jgi:hypothetical protein
MNRSENGGNYAHVFGAELICNQFHSAELAKQRVKKTSTPASGSDYDSTRYENRPKGPVHRCFRINNIAKTRETSLKARKSCGINAGLLQGQEIVMNLHEIACRLRRRTLANPFGSASTVCVKTPACASGFAARLFRKSVRATELCTKITAPRRSRYPNVAWESVSKARPEGPGAPHTAVDFRPVGSAFCGVGAAFLFGIQGCRLGW